MVNSKNTETLSPLGFDPDLSGPVGVVCNRTGLECLINSKIHYSFPSWLILKKSAKHDPLRTPLSPPAPIDRD